MMKKYQYITPREAPMIKDLAPNVCAVYTEEEYHCKGIAGNLLNMAENFCVWYKLMVKKE